MISAHTNESATVELDSCVANVALGSARREHIPPVGVAYRWHMS